jgi:hypothetical protein
MVKLAPADIEIEFIGGVLQQVAQHPRERR